MQFNWSDLNSIFKHICYAALHYKDHTIFAVGDTAALVAVLWVSGVAPRPNWIPVWVPTIIQLQAVSGCGSPSIK